MASIEIFLERAENGNRLVRFVPPLSEEQRALIMAEKPHIPDEAFTTSDDSSQIHLETGDYNHEWSDGIAANLAITSAGILSQSGENVARVARMFTIWAG